MKAKEIIKKTSNWKIVKNGITIVTSKNISFIKKEKVNFAMESDIVTTIKEIDNLIIVI